MTSHLWKSRVNPHRVRTAQDTGGFVGCVTPLASAALASSSGPFRACPTARRCTAPVASGSPGGPGEATLAATKAGRNSVYHECIASLTRRDQSRSTALTTGMGTHLDVVVVLSARRQCWPPT